MEAEGKGVNKPRSTNLEKKRNNRAEELKRGAKALREKRAQTEGGNYKPPENPNKAAASLGRENKIETRNNTHYDRAGRAIKTRL